MSTCYRSIGYVTQSRFGFRSLIIWFRVKKKNRLYKISFFKLKKRRFFTH